MWISIIGLLPVLMSMSLAIFLVGLVIFIILLRVTIASVVGAIAFVSFAAYLITNFLPILYYSCLYKTPLLQYILPPYTYIMSSAAFIFPIFKITLLQPRQNQPYVHSSKVLKLQLSSVVPMKQMYMPYPGYISCRPTPVFRALSYSL
ncbi:hypothetical protein DFS33DRAFT_937615 [Desarmillaria ectypa]|nr:hypothetical protein DFS33DRAFT_937615 [Desarmillaria ectypa]